MKRALQRQYSIFAIQLFNAVLCFTPPQVQLEKLTEQFQTVTEDMRRRFAVDGEPMVNAGHVSASSPLAMAASPLRTASVGFFRQTGFTPPQQSRPGIASSGAALSGSAED